jgi:hypothetical protein
VAVSQTCRWHPERETGLSCSRCGNSMCVECMRQHPVGMRCKECVRTAQLPTYRVSTSYLIRGVLAAVGLGVAGGIVLFILDNILGMGFFRFLIMLGLGSAIGEGVSNAVNKRRGRPFQYMAAGGVVTALGLSMLGGRVFNGVVFIDLWFLIGGVIALVSATSRLRA